MNKLYDSIEPVVVDDELLRKAIEESEDHHDGTHSYNDGNGNSSKDNNQVILVDKATGHHHPRKDFSEIETLKLSFKRMYIKNVLI